MKKLIEVKIVEVKKELCALSIQFLRGLVEDLLLFHGLAEKAQLIDNAVVSSLVDETKVDKYLKRLFFNQAFILSHSAKKFSTNKAVCYTPILNTLKVNIERLLLKAIDIFDKATVLKRKEIGFLGLSL